MMHWLKFCKIKLAKAVALSLIILKGISCNCVDFEVSKLLISYRISSWVTFRKEDTLLFIFSLKLRMLGWALHFLIAFEKNQIHRSFQLEIVYLCQFSKCFLYSQKAYWRYQQPFTYVILPPSLNITQLVPTILFERFDLTTHQKFLLSVMRLTLKEPSYFHALIKHSYSFVFYKFVYSSWWLLSGICFLISF